MLFVVGVVMLCTAAPSSDQSLKVQVRPAAIWGLGASSCRVMPCTPRTENGVATGCPSSLSCNPLGLEASVIVAVRGRMSTNVVFVSPAESRTVSMIR